MKKLFWLFCPLLLFAQPQSPNFIMRSETFSALAVRDSTSSYILQSTVGQQADVQRFDGPHYTIISGFLAPVWQLPAPRLSFDSDSLLFGDIWINTLVHDSVALINSGDLDVRLDSVHSDSPLIPSLTTPAMIPAGQRLMLPFAASVPETLLYSAHLIAFSTAGLDTLYASAHGIWTELRTNPVAIDVGEIAVGDSVDATLALLSAGNSSLFVTALEFTNNIFTLHGSPLDTIPAYGSSSVILRYVAESAGTFLDTLVISNSASAPVRVPLAAGATGVPDSRALPTTFFMKQNYPNPFNPSTTIQFGLPHSAEVSIEIFDLLGRRFETLVAGRLTAGFHAVEWSCGECPSGVYVARMSAGTFTATSKLLLLK